MTAYTKNHQTAPILKSLHKTPFFSSGRVLADSIEYSIQPENLADQPFARKIPPGAGRVLSITSTGSSHSPPILSRGGSGDSSPAKNEAGWPSEEDHIPAGGTDPRPDEQSGREVGGETSHTNAMSQESSPGNEVQETGSELLQTLHLDIRLRIDSNQNYFRNRPELNVLDEYHQTPKGAVWESNRGPQRREGTTRSEETR